MALRHHGIQNAFSTLVLSLVSEASATELSLAKKKKAEPGPWSEFSSPHWYASSSHIFRDLCGQEINLP